MFSIYLLVLRYWCVCVRVLFFSHKFYNHQLINYLRFLVHFLWTYKKVLKVSHVNTKAIFHNERFYLWLKIIKRRYTNAKKTNINICSKNIKRIICNAQRTCVRKYYTPRSIHVLHGRNVKLTENSFYSYVLVCCLVFWDLSRCFLLMNWMKLYLISGVSFNADSVLEESHVYCCWTT